MKFFLSIPLSLFFFSTLLCRGSSYELETIPFPEGVPPEVGALGFSPSGKLFVALRRSDVLVAEPGEDPADFSWKLFASGLHNACGIEVISDKEIVISQMPELTRIRDTDGDSTADLYESVAAPWGMSGNYHETNHLVPDGKGGWFVAVGTASHNGPVFYNVRGEYSKVGRRGRNFSAASWKGWILHIDKEGEATPWASGFRMHNGILLDSKGRLWAGDNQGDWKGTTPLYHVERGNFYGHVSSLIWDPEWDEGVDPLELPVEDIDEMRTPAAVLLPHDEMNRSAAEPVEIPEGDDFGPFGGQLLVPDNNGRRITRVMLENVGGVYQGACAQFLDDESLQLGNNRLVFSPDRKELYVGQTSRGWGQIAEGLQRVRFTGEVPFDVKMMSLTKEGFRLVFTSELNDASSELAQFKLRRYRYRDNGEYGSPKHDVSEIEISNLKQIDTKTLELMVPKLEGGGWVYELGIEPFKDHRGLEIRTGLICYTINRLR